MTPIDSREKGKVAEREVATILEGLGIHARRTGDAGQIDGDLDTETDFYFEIRRRERLRITEWCREVDEKCPEGQTGLVVHRRNHERWKVTLDFEDFAAIIAPMVR